MIHGHPALAEALRAEGAEVLRLHPQPGVIDLSALLREHGCTPDLLIQTENLADRTLLAGLPELACTKVFWSVDTHLNLSWHGLYGRLFDGVLATQRRLLPDLRHEGAGRTGWLPFSSASSGYRVCWA